MRRFKAAIVLSLLLALFAGMIHGTAFGNVERTRQNIEDTRKEITELEALLKALDDSIQTRVDRLAQLVRDLKSTEDWLVQAEKELVQSEIKLAETSQVFAARVRSAYMKGGISYLDTLLEAKSLGDLVIRAAYLVRILGSDANLIAAIRAEQNDVMQKKETAEQKRKSLADIRFQLETEQLNLAAERREKEVLLSSAKNRLAGELAKITPQAERKPVYGVVLDNAPQARPQSGLSKASVVYEYEVEGRITRMLALFATFPTKVGPIRSAREHSIMLAMENDVNYIYSSAGVDVLAKIREWEVKGINALYYRSSSLYRDSARRAPHNLYVNLSTLGVEKQSQEVTIRPAFLSKEGTSVKTIKLDYSPTYKLKYEYSANTGTYKRFVNDKEHKDATGEALKVRNIIIQYAPHFLDAQRRPTPNIIGEGKIDFYSQGQHFKGTWKKDDNSSPTRFFYEDGQEIERVYGQTWIQIARP